MKDDPSIVISGFALVVSVTTFCLTMRRGRLRMTRPALVGFLYDLPGGDPKIFFRTMLFSTGKRGHVLESLFLKVQHGESRQTFNFWVYGETSKLMIGSGLRVTEEGMAANHHFLPPKDGHPFSFLPGDYVIDVYARIVQRAAEIQLQTITLQLTPEHARALTDRQKGVLFIWGPDSQRYSAHIDSAPAEMGIGA